MHIETVRDWMTPNPLTVAPNTSMRLAQKTMLENSIRRLPVVKAGKLVGILTHGDIREAKPSDASSLSIYELNYLINRLEVSEIMTPNPITIDLEASMGEAARLMLENKVGGLPVMDGGKLVGIITEMDICRLLVQQPEFFAAA